MSARSQLMRVRLPLQRRLRPSRSMVCQRTSVAPQQTLRTLRL